MIHRTIIIPIACFLIITPCAAQKGVALKSLHESIERTLLSPLLDCTFAGIEVSDVESGEILFEQHRMHYFRPASTTKLVTTAAAVLLLPRDFTFETTLFSSPETDTVDLWIKGSGDPLLTRNELQAFATAMKEQGVRAVRAVQFDGSVFDTIAFCSGWMWDDETNATTPYISAFNIDRNRVEVTVTASSNGQSIDVSIEPKSNVFTIENSASIGNGKLKIARREGTNVIVVSGNIRSGEKQSERLSVWKPETVFFDALKSHLEAVGISLPSEFRNGNIPEQAQPVSTIRRSIDEVLRVTNKSSDNLCAEVLMKTVAALSGTGSTAAGLSAALNELRRHGVDANGISLVDGSGISFYNLITPAAMGSLLRVMAGATGFERFKGSLSVGGKDGTLATRLKGQPDDVVFAKTGTLRGISTLAGYVAPKKGKRLAFVISFENFLGEHKPYRELQDRIVRALVDYSRGSRTTRSR